MKKTTILRLTGLWLVAICLASCQTQQSVTTLKLAHGLNTKHPVHLALEYMGERLHEISGGTMSVDIYPSGQLGSERELIELLQIGSLAMTKVSSSPLEGFVPAMKIFSLPYVFRDDAHFWAVLESDIGQELLQAGQGVRLRGLAYYDAGSRNFYTVDKPVNTPDDLNGLKIRVQLSPTAMAMVKALGGAPTPISWGELYTALQQGVVDGAENNPPSFVSSKHYEVAKYFTLDEHTRVPDIILMSDYVWQRLDAQQQKWLSQAMAESVVYQRKIWSEATDAALATAKESGVEIIYPDKTQFQSRVKAMHDALQGSELEPLLKRIQKVTP